ncbi:hypothetical protein PENSPDRAFT_747122 [Peniophora sp. CONT]|nr:hypothetical protein PENSPDRAFT_747122 [Peniophora sp. CONT]
MAATSVSAATQPDLFNRLWSQALSNYTFKTKIDPSKHPLASVLTALRSPEDVCDVFQDEMGRFRASDSKWGKVRSSYVKPIVEAFIMVNDTLGETAGNLSLVPGGKVLFVAFGALLIATKGVSERYDALETLLEEIKCFFDSLRLRATSPTSWGHLSRSIASLILAHVLDVFALATKFLSDADRSWARLYHYGQSLMNKKDMQEALQRLRSLTALENRAISSETRVDAAECRKIAEQLRLESSAMKLARTHDSLCLSIIERSISDLVSRLAATDELRQILTAQEEAEATALLDRLDRLDYADLTAQRRGGCLQGTRIDVLEELRSWSEDPRAPRIYWLNGMAGTGKSAIARSFAQRLKDNGALGGTYFCSRESRAELTNTGRIIPTLAAALAGFDIQYKVALLSVLKLYSSEPRPVAWNLNLQVERLIVEPYARFMRRVTASLPLPVLVVDALDEAEDKTVSDLLDALVSVRGQLPIKFFLTSRPEKHIRFRLDSMRASLRLHDIESGIVREDIRRYVYHRFDVLREQFKVTTTLPEEWPNKYDIEYLVSLSGSLFIYAFTTTEYIGGRNPVKRLQDVLKVGRQSEAITSPLDDLDRIYRFILSAITVHGNQDELVLVKRILSAIIASFKPLSVNLLARLLGLEVYELKIALDELHAVIYVPDGLDINAVSTLHASFGDFLTDPRRAPEVMGGQFDHFYLPHDQQEDWHPPMIHRLGAARLTIDWTDAVHGEDWTKCYIGPQ